MIYLDNNATTPIDREVKDAMTRAFDFFGNPSSSHKIGNEAKSLIEKAREDVSALINCDASDVFFTSGGTESNNIAILGTAYKFSRGHIITSVIEHPSVLNPIRWLESKGFDVTYLPVDKECIVDPDEVKRAIRKDTILITIMHSNNETGVLQPISEISNIAKEFDIAFHTDAAQSVGKIAVDVSELKVDMLTIVSHKFYGPKGIAALYANKKKLPAPIFFGAGHERGLRPGTENIIGISGIGKASEIALRDILERESYCRQLRDKLFSLLKNGIDIRLNGSSYRRLPNTLNVSIRGVNAKDLVEKLKNDVAISSGAACHSGICEPSYVLKAMGLSDKEALSSIRLSVGKDNTIEDVEIAASKIISVAKIFLS